LRAGEKPKAGGKSKSIRLAVRTGGAIGDISVGQRLRYNPRMHNDDWFQDELRVRWLHPQAAGVGAVVYRGLGSIASPIRGKRPSSCPGNLIAPKLLELFAA
jgi:hypothetical protein